MSDFYGVLKAFAEIRVTNFYGETRVRKISLGTVYDANLDTAQDVVKELRGRNSEFHVVAELKVIL